MSKKIIRGFRTNMALYGMCLIAFVIVTIPFEPMLALGDIFPFKSSSRFSLFGKHVINF